MSCEKTNPVRSDDTSIIGDKRYSDNGDDAAVVGSTVWFPEIDNNVTHS